MKLYEGQGPWSSGEVGHCSEERRALKTVEVEPVHSP
jgi:hypothetical protein